MVGGGPAGATAVAALRFELEPDQGSPVLTLAVADNGDVNGASAVLGACPASSAWASTYAGVWTSKPASACARVVKGVRAADGMTWTFNLAALVVGNVIDVVLQPLEASNFNLTFNAPATAALKTFPRPVVAPAGIDATPASAPIDGDTVAADLAADAGLLVLDVPLSAPTNSDVAVLSGSRGSQSATPTVVSEPARRASGLGVLLLLAACLAAYALSQVPVPAARGLGRMRVTPIVAPTQVGGLGRFARLRSGPPPRL